LNKISISSLKKLGSNFKAFDFAKNISESAFGLSSIYGYFMINENMIFKNVLDDIFVWINPNILSNKVKIYLAKNHEGLKAMIKSIVCFLRLWLRFDYNALETASSF